MISSVEKHILQEQPASLRSDPAADLSLFHAGFWIRSIAAIIDLILLVVPFAVFVSFSAAAMGISNPFFNHRAGTPLNETLAQFAPIFLTLCICFFAAESWLYFALAESSHWHATLGKRFLGIYVADGAGKPIDFWRASLRFCGGRLLAHLPVLGGYYFVIDCLCVGLTPSKRAIHDRLSGCLVLREGAHSSFVR
ncbi:MAG TPA: RDD family protein [Candidatus Acidoferrum sp.]|nr:RDD family protein [Candidatus Acidoferrum sp.]